MRINLNNAHSTEVLLRQLMIIKKDRAIELLKLGSGLANANFREGQEEAIRHIVEARGRLLVVQKTGWGKSFVYFIATKLLREAGAGPALLISPLLALMRNQIAAAERMGVRAVTINPTIRTSGQTSRQDSTHGWTSC
jgi:superfamily II DNA helicase RecQ